MPVPVLARVLPGNLGNLMVDEEEHFVAIDNTTTAYDTGHGTPLLGQAAAGQGQGAPASSNFKLENKQRFEKYLRAIASLAARYDCTNRAYRYEWPSHA